MSLIIACGLKREARIITDAGLDAEIVIGGGVVARLERGLNDAIALFPGVILSFGLAGALDGALEPGDLVIDGERAVIERLRAILPHANVAAIIGSATIVGTVAAKVALAQQTGAAAVDMETGIARAFAARHDLPFGVVRAISDTARETLPPAALVGMSEDGGMALGTVLGSLGREPRQLAALIRTGRHAGRAFRALDRAAAHLASARFDRIELSAFTRD